jgi:hypothetical protein
MITEKTAYAGINTLGAHTILLAVGMLIMIFFGFATPGTGAAKNSRRFVLQLLTRLAMRTSVLIEWNLSV